MLKVKKSILGTVVSNKMNKTVVVKIVSKKPHPKYRKVVSKSKKIKAHTEDKIEAGTIVRIMEHKPFSKEKSWIVVK